MAVAPAAWQEPADAQDTESTSVTPAGTVRAVQVFPPLVEVSIAEVEPASPTATQSDEVLGHETPVR